MRYKIEEIEGIGPSFASKLAKAQITTTEHLLEQCCHARGRQGVASRTGLSEAQLLKWSNMADLMRISGIGPEFAELLEAAGVDTVKELRTRRAENLSTAMKEANVRKKLTRAVPSAKTVSRWIDLAKATQPKITH